jgi:hypothetical protein
MKPKHLVPLICLTFLGAHSLSRAQGTAFTFQGFLTDGSPNTPANGIYDLKFTLHNAESAGSQVGSAIETNDVTVASGVFTVVLDFGAGTFTGPPRWLETGVRPGTSTGAYTPQLPRQQLTPSPYAIYATTAGNANSVASNAVASAGIRNAAIITDKLADNAVTAAKIASGQVVKSLNGLRDNVTLAPGTNVSLTTNGSTLIVSATGGSGASWAQSQTLVFTNTTSTTFVELPVLTVTLQAVGKPVLVFLTAGSDLTNSYIRVNRQDYDTAGRVAFVRDVSVIVAEYESGQRSVNPTSSIQSQTLPASSFQCLDLPSPGLHTYTVRIRNPYSGQSTSIEARNIRLVAVEL